MELIITIIVGAITGWIASIIMKTDKDQGFFLDVMLGIAGSLLGQWFFSKFSIPFFNSGGLIDTFIIGIIGACTILFILKLFNSNNEKKS